MGYDDARMVVFFFFFFIWVWDLAILAAVHYCHGADCSGRYKMPGTSGNVGPGNGFVALSLRIKIFMLVR